MSQENVEIVRRAYESFNRWGVHPRGERNPEIPPLLHPEVEFHTYVSAPEAGVYRGRDAVIEYHERVFGQFESVRIELEELLSAGDRVVVISPAHSPQGQRGGDSAAGRGGVDDPGRPARRAKDLLDPGRSP